MVRSAALLLLLIASLGCDASAPVADAPGGAASTDEAIDSPERIERARRGDGPFFLLEHETEREIFVMQPGEVRPLSVDEEIGYHTNVLLRSAPTEAQLEAAEYDGLGQPKLLKTTGTSDEFGNVEYGQTVGMPIISGDPPWEFDVENVSGEPLLVQIVDYRAEMNEMFKKDQQFRIELREKAKKQDKFDAAMKAWRDDPQGDAPRKEDFGL